MRFSKYISIYILLLFISLSSCKIFQEEDNTNPTVNFSIEGGNEISREVTLYLEIEDDSDIDSVQVIIDDSTYATFYSNFDTIKFIVNEFKYIENEEIEEGGLLKSSNSLNEIDVPQLLYVKVHDEEGNIGESDKQEITITDYPGWRKYYNFELETWGPSAFLVDDNNLIWISTNSGVIVYNPKFGTTRQLTIPTTDNFYNTFINDIALIEGSRVWLASDYRILEYHYEIDKWLQFAVPPPDTTRDYNNQLVEYRGIIWSIAVDANYDVYIGTDGRYISKYNGANFQQFALPGASVFSMEVHPNGTIYYFNEWGKRSYIYNNTVYEYDNFPYEYGMVMNMIIDADGIVWIESRPGYYGCFLYDGSTWSKLLTNNPTEIIYPILGAKNGIVYAEIDGYYSAANQFEPSLGIATYDGIEWTYWRDLDTPFKAYEIGNIPSVVNLNSIIDEAPNGDIWMVLDNVLWRYRPSIGGYP